MISSKKRKSKQHRRLTGSDSVTLMPRQLQVLRIIGEYRDNNGFSPTLQEIAQKLKLSKVTVFEHVEALVQKGFLHRQGANKARSLTVNHTLAQTVLARPGGRTEAVAADTDSSSPLVQGEFPLAGYIAAGLPLEAVENVETLDVGSMFRTHGEVFALAVRGDSMIDDHIRDGDYVLIRKCRQARDGQTVVALLDNGEATLKKIYRRGRRWCLQPANPDIKPIYTDKLKVQGVVIGLIRCYAAGG